MSSLVTTGSVSRVRPYPIYNGPRTGDEFLEWNMGSWGAPGADLLQGLGALWGMGQIDQLFAAAAQTFGNVVESIEFRSQVTPPIVIDRPFAPAGTATAPTAAVSPGSAVSTSQIRSAPQAQIQGGTPFLTAILDRAAKPAMYVRIRGGAVYAVEPWGRPEANYTKLLAIAAGLTLLIGGVVGVKLGQRMICPRKA